MVCSPLGEILFVSFLIHWGTGEAFVDSTHKGVSSTLWGNSFLHSPQGFVFMPWTHGGILYDTWEKLVYSVTYWGFG